MGLLAKIKGMVEYKRYLKTLSLSTALALLTLYIAFGLMFFATEGNYVPGPFILLIFAIFFSIFTVFYESRGKSKSRGKGSVKSLIKGLFLGICATFAFIATLGGVILTLEGDIPELSLIISALAICMIVSTVFLSLLKPSEVKEKI
jgi:asparagine N-glycosylation enzyme membrane subunit Stt3